MNSSSDDCCNASSRSWHLPGFPNIRFKKGYKPTNRESAAGQMTSSSSDDSCIETDGEGEDVVEEKDEINVSAVSESPYLALEQETAAMVAKLRLNPLLPQGVDADSGERVQGLCCGLCDARGPSEAWKEAHIGAAERLWLGEHLG